jgi:glycosyltransferase involved in cell wall biosynthesis
MAERLEELQDEIRPDLVHVHLIRMAQYATGPLPRPRILDLRDAISLYLQRFAESERNPVKRAILRSELRRMLRYEPVIAGFALSVICSELDRATVLDHVPGARVSIVRNGVDLSRFARHDGTPAPDEHRVIFTGNMSYFPNADGAEYFVRSVLPHIKREVPETRTYLVGQNPPPRVRSLAREDIVVTGFVEDIAAEYARSVVAVAPIRYGAGTLNKLLEPMAMGIPVVTTSMGSGGIDLVPGEDLLVADGPEEFASHVVRLMRDPALRGRMGASAAAKVRARYGWEDVVASLEEAYTLALQDAGAR